MAFLILLYGTLKPAAERRAPALCATLLLSALVFLHVNRYDSKDVQSARIEADMKHDVLAVLVANLTAFLFVVLFRRWHKSGSHIGAYIVILTVVWAWFDRQLYSVQAIACLIGVLLMGAELTGKLPSRKRHPIERLRDE